MTTWTKMKIDDLVKIEWADAFKKFVICKTVYGDLIESVDSLKSKLQSDNLLSAIRKIYSDMLEFAEGNKNEKASNQVRNEPRS